MTDGRLLPQPSFGLELVNRSNFKRHEFSRKLHTNARLEEEYLFKNESEPRLLT